MDAAIDFELWIKYRVYVQKERYVWRLGNYKDEPQQTLLIGHSPEADNSLPLHVPLGAQLKTTHLSNPFCS